MARLPSFVLVCVFLIVFPIVASAGHPSVETWSTVLDSDDTTDCLTVTTLEGPQSLVNVENQCTAAFTLDGVTCSSVDCMLQSMLQVEPEATRQISSFDIGLFGNELQMGDEVDVEIEWSLGTADNGTIALTLTYEGFTGGEHDFDDGTVPSDDGGAKSDPGCGGCASADPGPTGLAMLMLLGLAVSRRTPRRS